MIYNLIRKDRKSIKVFLQNGIINVYAPKFADINLIEKIVDSFYKKYYDTIINLQQYNNNYIFIFGKKINKKNLGIKDINYAKIKSIFNNSYKDIIVNRIKILSNKINVNYTEISFRKLKSRWGSLDSKGRLKFNYLIFMLQPELIDYLIIHELCHLIHFNHSKEFWHSVSYYLPDYKKYRKELKECNYLISLFN
jgi:predicted metal-dependent hydrolase